MKYSSGREKYDIYLLRLYPGGDGGERPNMYSYRLSVCLAKLCHLLLGVHLFSMSLRVPSSIILSTDQLKNLVKGEPLGKAAEE